MAHVKSSIKNLVETIAKADQGDYDAMSELVSNYYGLRWSSYDTDGEIGQRILCYIIKLAEAEDVAGCIWLGDAYRYGDHGLKIDLQKANECFAKAIALADAPTDASPAYEAVADNFYYGKGCEKNYKEAFKLYKIASANSTYGRYMVAEMYRLGQGVRKNLKLALQYYELCADIDNYFSEDAYAILACFRATQAYHYGWGTEVDLKLAQKYIETILDEINGFKPRLSITDEDLKNEWVAIIRDTLEEKD